MAAYQEIKRRWEASSSCIVLKDALRQGLCNMNGEIKTCVLFGNGTMSGFRESWAEGGFEAHELHETALYQVVVFESAIETIGMWIACKLHISC